MLRHQKKKNANDTCLFCGVIVMDSYHHVAFVLVNWTSYSWIINQYKHYMSFISPISLLHLLPSSSLFQVFIITFV